MSKTNFQKILNDIDGLLEIIMKGGHCDRKKRYDDLKHLSHHEIEEFKSSIKSRIEYRNSEIAKDRNNRWVKISEKDPNLRKALSGFLFILTCVNCLEKNKEYVFRLQFLVLKQCSLLEFHKIT